MKTHSLHCILNNRDLTRYDHAAMTVLDFVRLSQKLTGTKEGCREGDCGACTVLVGRMRDGGMHYRAINSCLLPLGDMNACHIVTVEGLRQTTINLQRPLTPVQQAMADCGGTQCGFCTPGFIMSMTGYLLNTIKPDFEGLLTALDGNICRCTGYMSIRRAAQTIIQVFEEISSETINPIERCIQARVVPSYFTDIPRRISTMTIQDELVTSPTLPGAKGQSAMPSRSIIIAGGTDLFVQKGEALAQMPVFLLNDSRPQPTIQCDGAVCTMDAHTTIAQIVESDALYEYYPSIRGALQYFASTPIRERATVAGNIANASPIGDVTAVLLALNAELVLADTRGLQRTVLLKNFYTGYKTLDKKTDELIVQVRFDLPKPDVTTLLSIEKVSRRTYLDIASVNSALKLVVHNTIILEAHVSAGGVAPIPLYLSQTSAYLHQKPISPDTFREAQRLSMEEAKPISDARGSATYKQLLLGNMMVAHALTMFPHYTFQEIGQHI